MVHVRLCKTHSLHDDLINFILDSVHGLQTKVILQFLEHKLIGAFTSLIIGSCVVILDKGTRFLVDGVVSQVHAQVVQVTGGGARVLDCGETGQPILVNVNAQRRNAINEHINAQVKLVAVYQVWLVHVSLDNHVLHYSSIGCVDCLLCREGLRITSQENALALTTCFGLDDKSAVALLIYLSQKFFEVSWKVVSWRKEVVVLGED